MLLNLSEKLADSLFKGRQKDDNNFLKPDIERYPVLL